MGETGEWMDHTPDRLATSPISHMKRNFIDKASALFVL